MAQFPGITLTNAGLNMIAESQATSTALIFTSLKMGDGTLSAGDDIKLLTSVKNPVLTAAIQSYTNQGDGQIKLRFTISNGALTTGFFAREIGIYAKVGTGGTEQLYAYTNAGNLSDYIPDKNTPIDEQIIDIYLVVGNASSVQIVTDSSIMYVTMTDFNEHKTNPTAHADIITAHNSSGTAHEDIRELAGKSGEQIGTIKPWLVTVVPAGWLALDTGALVSRTTYAELWAWVQANAPLISESAWQTQATAQSSVGAYSAGDGSTTFRLPRILDYVRGGLTADVGKWQGDAIRNITGTFGNDGYGGTIWTGAFAGDNTIYTVANSASATDTGMYKTTFDASKVVPTADENRPKTIKMIYCVKAFDATTNQGLIDITALANEMAAKVNSVDVGFKIVYPNGGTSENPATITINSRYVISNPFPGYFIQCKAQVFDTDTQKWATWDNIVSSNSLGYGLCTNYNSTDDTIILQVGTSDIWGVSNLDGNPFNRTNSTLITSAKCRVLVWKGGSLA